MKLFNTATTSNVNIVGHGTTVLFSTANNYEVEHFTAVASGTSRISQDYNEFIEIPSGCCIYLIGNTCSAYLSKGKVTFRWIELDA